jgi:hypothetical protein
MRKNARHATGAKLSAYYICTVWSINCTALVKFNDDTLITIFLHTHLAKGVCHSFDVSALLMTSYRGHPRHKANHSRCGASQLHFYPFPPLS